MKAPDRARALTDWLPRALADLERRATGAVQPLTVEASSRRFYRVPTTAGPLILMDAPPEREHNEQYLALGRWLRRHGLCAPRVFAVDAGAGFLLIEDLGDGLLGRHLEAADATRRRSLYRTAIDTLIRFQRAGLDDPPAVPDYDEARLRREFGLFREWFSGALLGAPPPAGLLEATEDALVAASLAQPRICVYLDYHSRNLLVLPDGELGLVDFQDVHHGPITYDLVSLLRDCYLRWPEAEVSALREYYLQAASRAGIPGLTDQAAFERGFDLCGIQRQLKALGIFARLHLEAGRDSHLADMPRVMHHLATVCPEHPETRELGRWLADTAAPELAGILERRVS